MEGRTWPGEGERYEVREDGSAAYGVWDRYLVRFDKTGLTEGDAGAATSDANRYQRYYEELCAENICLRCDDTMPDGAVVCPHCGGDQRSLAALEGAAALGRGIITIRRK